MGGHGVAHALRGQRAQRTAADLANVCRLPHPGAWRKRPPQVLDLHGAVFGKAYTVRRARLQQAAALVHAGDSEQGIQGQQR